MLRRSVAARQDVRPTSVGLLSLLAEVEAEPTPQLEAQRALLGALPAGLRPLAGPRLRLAVAELRRREATVTHG